MITLMIIRENKLKKRHIFERFWGFKISVEGGSDRQQAGFLILPSVVPHRNVKICQILFSSSTSMFSLSFVNSCCRWNHSKEQNISQKLLKVADTLKQKNCKQTYQFSVSFVSCKREILLTYLSIGWLQILKHI